MITVIWIKNADLCWIVQTLCRERRDIETRFSAHFRGWLENVLLGKLRGIQSRKHDPKWQLKNWRCELIKQSYLLNAMVSYPKSIK